MNKYNDFFNDNPWKDITEPLYPKGHRLFINDERFWISMNGEGQIVLFVHGKYSGSLEVPDSLAGVSLDVVAYPNSAKRLICTLTSCDKEIKRKFTIVTKDIAYKCDGLEDNLLFNKVVEIIRSWASFLKPQKTGLTESEYIGFLGELYTLVEVISYNHSPAEALNFWVGPNGKNQDFIFNNIAIEVKTSFSSEARKISISSLNQLEKVTDNLYIYHLIFNPSESGLGLSLKGLYEKFKDLIDNNLELELEFFRKISNLYGKANDRQLKNNNFLISEATYEVTDSFPCIRNSDVPNSVAGVRYDLLIPSIKGYEVDKSIKDIIKHG